MQAPFDNVSNMHSITDTGSVSLEGTFFNLGSLFNFLVTTTAQNLICTTGAAVWLISITAEEVVARNLILTSPVPTQNQRPDSFFVSKIGKLMHNLWKKLSVQLNEEGMFVGGQDRMISKRKPDLSTTKKHINYNTLTPSGCSVFDKMPNLVQFEIPPASIMEPIDGYHQLLKDHPYAEYVKLVNSIKDSYKEVESRKERITVKLYSISCGMHERYCPKHRLEPENFRKPVRISNQAVRLHDDMFPRSKESFSENQVARINKLVQKNRTPATKALLTKAGVNLKKVQSSQYIYSGERCFFSKTHNGRPDFVLMNKDGVVVGVVEVKRLKGKVSEDNLKTYIKQAAHYKLLFSAVESYLVLLGDVESGIHDHFYAPSPCLSATLPEEISNMLNNIEKYNRIIAEFSN